MSEKLPRPSQVTLAGWLIVGGSLGVLATVYSQLSRLRSLDTRESIEKTLAEPPFDHLGLDVGTVLDTMHVLALVTGAFAAAAVVLGWHVLRRHQASRIVLTVLAVPLLLSGMASGGFFSTLVAVAVVLLWVPQSRDWFRGIPAREGPPAGPSQAPGEPRSSQQLGPNPRQRPYAQQAPEQGAPQAAPRGAPTPPPYPSWLAGTPHPAAPVRTGQPVQPPQSRPATVTWAAVLTWILCALGALGLLAVGVICTAAPGPFYDEMMRQNPELRDQGLTEDLVVVSMWIGVVMGLAAIAFTAVMAYLTTRGVAWARVTLVVLVAIAIALLLIASLMAPVMVAGLSVAAVTLALLLRPETRAWFHRFDR